MVQAEKTEIKVTHAVFKHEDVSKLPQVFRNDLATIAWAIRSERAAVKKNPMPEYIVINTDEDTQMIDEIITVMKRYNKWD